MKIYKNYDTPIHIVELSIKGLDTYPRYTGGLITDTPIKNNDIVTIGTDVPLEMAVTRTTGENGLYSCSLDQYMGINIYFSKSLTINANTEYQRVIREVFGDIVFFELPVYGKITKAININEGDSRWEVINMLSEEFSFNINWYKSDRLYMVKPKTNHPIRVINSSVYRKYGNKDLYNHVTIANEENEPIEVFTEDYFTVGQNKMTPVTAAVVSDKYNMIKYGERLLKKERQTKMLITGALQISEYPEIVNEIGEVWIWNNTQCRVRSIEITGNSYIVTAGQEEEEILSYDLDSEREMRGIPHIWLL